MYRNKLLKKDANMIKVIFLGGLFPKEIKKEIENKSIGVVQYAADALQWAIVDGLKMHLDKFTIVNLPYIGSFPTRYKEVKTKSFDFIYDKTVDINNVGFINLPLYKLYSRYYNAKKTLDSVLQDDNEIILIYAIHTPFIKAAVDLKKKNPSLKICLIVPDLPEFMGGSDSILHKFLKNGEQKLLNKILKKVDAFVLLSKYMHEPLQVGNRPWVRVEGIFNSIETFNNEEKEHFKTILYSGTLAKRYGILNLLEAFSMIKDENYRLWICGEGDAKNELIELAKKDKRIRNFGQITRDEVLKLQKKATILVNPRTSEGAFTKYSFPSKTMEYLASGTPCLMHNLAGIPEEYLEYCFISNNETPFGLSQSIVSVCGRSQSELDEFGERAKNFILKNKSPEKQCEKIYNMLKNL
jgi:glycosyltransferase involved in cell wall biosynthesis